MANPRRADYATQYEQWQQRFQKGKGGNRSWSEAQQEAQNNAFAALAAPFDLIAWLTENWQAAVVIVISLLILTRG